MDVLLVSTYILIVIRSAHSKRTVRQKLRILHLLLRGLLGVVHALIHITVHCVHGIVYIVIEIVMCLGFVRVSSNVAKPTNIVICFLFIKFNITVPL